MKHYILAVALTTLVSFGSCQNNRLVSQKEQIPLSNDNTVFEEVDKMPEFENGFPGFYKYIQSSLTYPEEAKRLGVEGKVFVEFIISKTGAPESAKVVKGIGAGCDEAALQIIQNSPTWKAGIKDGKAVNVKLVLPITFKLN